MGGIGIFPQALRNLARLRFDIDVLMGLAIVGAMALGQWDEAATVAFLYGLSEVARVPEPGSRHGGRSGPCWSSRLPTAERIGPDGTTQTVAAEPDSPRRTGPGAHRRHDPGRRHGRSRAFKRRTRRRSRANRCQFSARPGDPVYAGTVNGDGTLEVKAVGAGRRCR